MIKKSKPERWTTFASCGGGVILTWLALCQCPLTLLVAQPAGSSAIEILHPLSGAVMPANMPAPAVLWKTNASGVERWSARFNAGGKSWSFDGIQPMWRPPEAAWCEIRQAANSGTLELTVVGHEGVNRERMKAQASVRFAVAAEAVQTPLFYREVNLPFSEAVKDPSTIRWRFGALDTGRLPPVVLEKLPVCGNCHSFSRDGKHFAMDVDYSNNKGSYVITQTRPEMKLATSEIITWDDYRREDGQPTLGLLSQISPDGRHVLSTVKDMSVFMAKPDLAFSQLFFPFKGIVGVYDREARKFSSLPGADDPDLVQSNPTWSPDGQWVVFARTRAIQGRKTRDPGRILLTGEAGEEFMREMKDFRYDLYRVPFNGGKGGKAEPLRGASANGRSNYFPKYSPDGRWIIFCQAANYMLLQPDSELFIIPAEGGPARRLGCNLGRMNSWHTWSPDGRWLVFSSKGHSLYTQLYLSRISEQGEASPPVWLAHMTEPGRAANIPEFVSLPADGIVRIREQFLDDYSYVRAAGEFYRAGDLVNAIEKYRLALSLNPDNVTAHQMLGSLLYRTGHRQEGRSHMETAVRLDPEDLVSRFDLGLACSGEGDQAGAIAQLEEAVRRLSTQGDRQYGPVDAKPAFRECLHFNLGNIYRQAGDATEAESHFREAVSLAPDYPQPQFALGLLSLGSGRLPEAEDCFGKVLQLVPRFADAHNALGVVRQRQNRGTEAVACFQKAIQCDTNCWQAHLNLAFAYLSEGQPRQAIPELEETLRINPSCEPARQALQQTPSPLP